MVPAVSPRTRSLGTPRQGPQRWLPEDDPQPGPERELVWQGGWEHRARDLLPAGTPALSPSGAPWTLPTCSTQHRNERNGRQRCARHHSLLFINHENNSCCSAQAWQCPLQGRGSGPPSLAWPTLLGTPNPSWGPKGDLAHWRGCGTGRCMQERDGEIRACGRGAWGPQHVNGMTGSPPLTRRRRGSVWPKKPACAKAVVQN